ncbi:DotU family type IV/VI secretion system protein [Acanthopleuribacter pedis]|uniref:DotU family type IV/VI secretion system protein n=1 Tax=Acanthopleuribacter pedis TaxID=442870 RepID=A0A8J7QAW5_9BACT|nr:DotU family type IV/VI secretion system protein [Acanthopleuribacter pedis]MBO1321072.1 DotU family type IV/VI secretion system protein [Acanthopleuribacter pedis]
MNDPTRSFLYRQFLQFYRETAALVHRIQIQADPERRDEIPGDYESLNRKTVSDKLMLVLDRQAALVAGNRGAVEPRLYDETRYVMVAVADELFLDLQWAHRDAWGDHLLEEQMFGSQAAGDLFFSRLDALLALNGPVYEDLAKVYLTALALGFRGRYRVGDPNGEVAVYQHRLYHFIFKHDPHGAPRPLFPQNQEVGCGDEPPQHLPTIQRWLQAGAAVAALWLLGTSLAWWSLSAPVRALIAQVIQFR